MKVQRRKRRKSGILKEEPEREEKERLEVGLQDKKKNMDKHIRK